MPNFADVHLKPEVLARYGLPDIAYPIASADLKSAVDAGGELPLAMMLHGLQVSTRDGGTEWKRYEPAMSRLAELLAPDDGAMDGTWFQPPVTTGGLRSGRWISATSWSQCSVVTT